MASKAIAGIVLASGFALHSMVVLAAAASPMKTSESEARRLLAQASFGPTEASVAEVQQLGFAAWLEAQFSKPLTGYPGFPYMDSNSNIGCPATAPATCFRDHYTLQPMQEQFLRNALSASDQLRQRVALALSQIMVVSGRDIRQPYAMANYQRIFLDQAFGNFRTILREVTLSPAMGDYLDMVNNAKPNPAKGIAPNENYAREVLQLFSIGLWQLNADGSLKLDAQGKPQPSYSEDQIEAFAHVFTGWTYAPRPGVASVWPNKRNYEGRMVAFANQHDMGTKTLLSGKVLPAGQTAEADLEAAIDNIFQHPNVGPFIGRQLIQQLVTSNPSKPYVARVTAAFNNNGKGVRGDMKAVLRAILLDSEARKNNADANFGKLREPILYTTHLMRGLGGQSDGIFLRQQLSSMEQLPFSPNSVFNFYPPDFALPGNSALQGPPFGIYHATTAFARANFTNSLFSSSGQIGADKSVPGSTGTQIDYNRWLPLAGDANKLADELNRVFLNGNMSTGLRQVFMQTVLAVPANKPTDRVRAALYLVANAPEYLVEH